MRSSMSLSYFHQIGTEPLLYKTIFEIFDETAVKYADQIAVVDCAQEKKITFSEYQKQVNALAAGILALGFQKGDRLGIWGPNSIEWCITYLAAAKAGLILVLLNPLYIHTELEYCINKVQIKGIITPNEFKSLHFLEILTKLCPDLNATTNSSKVKSSIVPSLSFIIIINDEAFPGTLRFQDVLKMGSGPLLADLERHSKQIQPEDACNIQFTSGTTGKPKATLLNQMALVNNSYTMGKRFGFQGTHCKILAQVPLFHAIGPVGVCVMNAHFGTTIVLSSPIYSPVKSLQAIESEKCTAVYGTPTMFIDMANVREGNEYDVSSVTVAGTGGAGCSEELIHRMKSVLKMDVIKEVYGMTECTGTVNILSRSGVSDLETFVDHLEVKIIDENGRVVPLGTPGELCVRGYSTMLKYWNDEESTRATMDPNGWLKTGDQFILQSNGKAKMVGRIKDMINRGGENIFPQEIEDLIDTHPNVSQSSVFAIPDQRLGEAVCVAIKLKSQDAKLTIEDVKSFCKGNIAAFKIPEHLRIVSDFPKTPLGKIQKFKLKNIVVGERSSDLQQK